MVNLKSYVEKRLDSLRQIPCMENLRVDKRIEMKGFETTIVKTKWGVIVFQSNGKRISETWLTLMEIETMLKLHGYINCLKQQLDSYSMNLLDIT